MSADEAEGRELTVRGLREDELAEADRVFRLAFGTFLGLPDPLAFAGDADFVRARFRADPAAAFAAVEEGRLVGSVFATGWGSFGFFGPLTIRPDRWDRGLGGRLLEPVIERFEAWGTKHAGLYTFAQSPKHHGLYQKFGFWPRFLRPILSRPTHREAGPAHDWQCFSTLAPAAAEELLRECAATTDAVFEGLNVEREIRAVRAQQLGDTVVVRDGSRVGGFAVCHCGPGSEAGSGTGYVKFGAVRPGPRAPANLRRLLAACDAWASGRGARRIVAGVSAGRSRAYGQLLELGFRSEIVGVSMHRPNEAGYDRPDVFVLDDWR